MCAPSQRKTEPRRFLRVPLGQTYQPVEKRCSVKITPNNQGVSARILEQKRVFQRADKGVPELVADFRRGKHGNCLFARRSYAQF